MPTRRSEARAGLGFSDLEVAELTTVELRDRIKTLEALVRAASPRSRAATAKGELLLLRAEDARRRGHGFVVLGAGARPTSGLKRGPREQLRGQGSTST